MTQNSTLKTFLWFNDGLQAALLFYKRTFGDGMQVAEEHLNNDNLFTADFSIYGHEFVGHPDHAKAEENWGILRNMTKIQLSDFIA